ncbi:MAG: hypothetical protein HGB19_10045, partial [Chlorobiales bacterium]|nr:hypothetical protein [Chlorobiales bacterium]
MASKPSKLIVGVLLIVLVFLSVKCAKDTEIFPPFEAGQLGALTTGDSTLGKPDKLSIVFASPQGEVNTMNDANSISVIFNQPMVELTDESQSPATEGPITFEPSIKGTYRWIGTRTLSFTPSDTLEYSKSYTARIASGIKAISGQTLTEELSFSFTTPHPQLLWYYPESPSQEIGLQEDLILRFNQRAGIHFLQSVSVEDSKGNKVQMNARTLSEDAAKKLSEEFSGTNNYSASYVLNGGLAENLLLLKPDKPLTPGETYTLKFSSDKHPKDFQFAPFKPFSYEGEQTISITPGEGLELKFSNSVSPRDIIENMLVSPAIDTTNLRENVGTYSSRTPYIYLPLKAATNYTVKINPNIKDRFGNTLGKALTLKLSVGDYAPNVSIPTGRGLVENDLLKRDSLIYPSIPIQSINIESVRFYSAQLSTADLLNIETGNVDFYSEELLNLRGQQSNQILLGKKRNQSITYRFDLQSVLKGRSSGFVLFQLKSQESEYYQRSLIQVTSLAVTAKFSREGSLIFVSRLKDSAPVQGATVQLYHGKKPVWKGQTDKQGVAKTPDFERLGVEAVDYDNPLIAIISSGTDVAYTTSKWDDGIQPYRFDIPFAYNFEEQSLTGKLYSERGIYRAGESVFLKGVIRQKKAGIWTVPKQKKYFLTIYNSRNEQVQRKAVQIDPTFASFSDSLKLADNTPLGYYSMSLTKDTSATYSNITDGGFRVEAYRPATFAVNVKASQAHYVSGETIKATIEGRYLFGAPMSEDKVRWSLQRSQIPDFGFNGYDGYFWQMLDWNREETESNSGLIGSGSGKLSRDGEFTLSQKLDLTVEETS